MSVTSSILRRELLTLKFWYPILMGLLAGMALAYAIFPYNQEIDHDDYRWLMEQVKLYPEFKEPVYEKLSDDGYINNQELWRLKKALRQYAKNALSKQLHTDQQP